MDSFGAFGTEGEWDLCCSSILSLEELDFTPHCLGLQGLTSPIIPPAGADGITDAWFCSLDSFTANLPCVFEATSSDDINNSIDQLPRIAADDHHIFMSTVAGAVEEKKNASVFSACSDVLLQEITGFSGEDGSVNMDIETHQGYKTSTPANALHHKRKSTVVPDDDDQNKLNNPNKKIRTSSNVQKTRKPTDSNAKTSQTKLSTRRRKCEEEDQDHNAGCDMNSCSSDNSSEDDNGSQETNGGTVLEGEASPAKGKTRASRGSATDPQSLYARKRRERINERLRILQKLVPNGTKVDISTMLEEAVHYVKFLQLQIKLLSSDELWMYAPIAYNGMDIGLQQKLSPFL